MVDVVRPAAKGPGDMFSRECAGEPPSENAAVILRRPEVLPGWRTALRVFSRRSGREFRYDTAGRSKPRCSGCRDRNTCGKRACDAAFAESNGEMSAGIPGRTTGRLHVSGDQPSVRGPFLQPFDFNHDHISLRQVQAKQNRVDYTSPLWFRAPYRLSNQTIWACCQWNGLCIYRLNGV